MKQVGLWNTSRYLNVYVYPSSTLGGVLGAGTFPTIRSNQGETESFVIMSNRALSPLPPHFARSSMGHVLVHEVGHYLFLHHPWGFDGCESDDECPDTPRTSGASLGCDANADDPGCSEPAMTQNYMDYSGDACVSLFTSCQKGRMRGSLALLRSNLYAAENNALDGDHPAIDMTIYKDFQESRPDALFFNSATGRFRSPELFVANQGRTAVSRATLVFAINGTEVTRFDATNNFGFCDVATLTIPSSVQNRLAATTLDLSRENTLAIWVDAEGENYRANDTLIVTDRAKNAPDQTFTLAEEHLDDIAWFGDRRDVGTMFGGGATDYHITGADSWVDIHKGLVEVTEGEVTRNVLRIGFSPNPLHEERKDTLYFTPTGGVGKQVEDTLYLTQMSGENEPGIEFTFTPAVLDGLSPLGGTVMVDIDISGTGIEWILTLPTSGFVTSSAQRGTEDATIALTYAANPTSNYRSNTAIFTLTDGMRSGSEIHILSQQGGSAGIFGTSSKAAEASSSVKLFPNPSNGEVFLSLETEKKQEVQVSFFDALGTLAHRQILEVAPNGHRIALSPKVAGGGLYFVHVKGENLDELKRLVMR